jgi:hypothetical protein
MSNCLVPVFVALLALPVTADQNVPDFTGRWVAVEPASIAGHELRITQDASAITLEQTRLRSRQTYDDSGRPRGEAKGEREKSSYRLDGQPTISNRGAGDAQQVRSTLRWKNDGLLLIDTYPATHLKFERTLRFAARDRLVLEFKAPPVTSDDPVASSAAVLEPARIVFERR